MGRIVFGVSDVTALLCLSCIPTFLYYSNTRIRKL